MLFPFDRQAFTEDTAELDRRRERHDVAGPFRSREWAGRLRRDLEAEAVAASTQLEGVAVTVDEVRRILAGDPPREVSPAERAQVEGYHDAMRFVVRRADDPSFRWNRELIVGLHDRAMGGDAAAGAGRIRQTPTAVRSARTGEVVFRPPEDGVGELVDRLCEQVATMVEGGGREAVHPAIAAGWLHVAFAAVHPFRDGNGRTARVLASTVMYRGGFRSPFFTSLEEWWGNHPADYYAAFACLGERFDSGVDVTAFIREHVGAQLSQVRALDLRERTQRRLWALLENIVAGAGMRARTANALWEAFFGRDVTVAYYSDLADVSGPTARNDLAALTAAAFLKPEGRTRGRKYIPRPAAIEAVAAQLGVDAIEDTDELRGRIVAAIGESLIAE